MIGYNLAETFAILLLMSIEGAISNALSGAGGVIEGLPGLLILVGISMAGILLGKYAGKDSCCCLCCDVRLYIDVSGFPGDVINFYMKKVGFVSLCTLILAYAGVSIGKDMDAFKSTGWRIVILSCVIFAGTYLGSVIAKSS